MAKYINREELIAWLKRIPLKDLSDGRGLCRIIMEEDFKRAIRTIPDGAIIDAVQVVRCRDCINAEPLERNCELNANFYMHCRLWRGEECENVWHKYKQYFRDYSLVQHDDFCSSGERRDGDKE